MAPISKGLEAAIFDMDGVITRTANLHAAAWKQTFDEHFSQDAQDGRNWTPFNEDIEYRAYVDGKPRLDGVRSFLRARNIAIPAKEERELAERKDVLFERILEAKGVQVFASTIALIQALRARRIRVGVVTSSRHGRQVLDAAGITTLFDACLDGTDIEPLSLKGKPDPDMFLQAAKVLRSTPKRTMIVEDAVSGVQAGRRGDFGLVVGVDRGGNADALRRGGADLVVPDLGEINVAELEAALQNAQEAYAWKIEQVGFDLSRERQMESLFAVGNGYMGVRGALDTPLPSSQCDLFVAGVFDHKRSELPYSELEFLTPSRGDHPYTELVALPFPFRLQISVDDTRLDFAGDNGRELRRILELRCGMLHNEAVYETRGWRRTTVHTRRCASLADRHLLLQDVYAIRENHWGNVALTASLDEPELARRHPHLQLIEHATTGDIEFIQYKTRTSEIEICIASRAAREGERLRRLVSVFTSRDVPDPVSAALTHLQGLDIRQFDILLDAHGAKWHAFWIPADIRISGRPTVEQALRFGSYHLRLPANDDERSSIGARSLTGRGYEGHVFWDVEIFMLPFYLHVDPTLARKLLLYRHHTLDGARRRARELGYRGACYAWESTLTGDDVTPTKIVLKSSGKEIPIFTGTQQVHVTADVAYGVWRYWEATRDEEFMIGPGADILFDTARFWMSRVMRGERYYHLRCVIGPDEYHHSVNDNAYTNWMVRFNLERAAWLARDMGVNMTEADDWAGLAHQLYVPMPDERGVIEQFEGFFDLDDYPIPPDERFRAPVSRLFDWEQINRLKLVKQADVLMLPMLFPADFSDKVVAANYHYYEPLTDHGSSLSPSVHAAIAARVGLHDDAKRYWTQSLWLDLSDTMDNSMLGVHPAALGGTWQALVFGMLGVHFSDDGPVAHPDAGKRLPPELESVELNLFYRGRTYPIKVTRSQEGGVSQ